MNSIIKRAVDGPWLPATVGKSPYMWIGSLVFFLLKYFMVSVSAVELALAALTVIVFVPLYFISFWPGQGKGYFLSMLTVCLMGALWTPYNAGASVFFIFAAGMCAGIVPPRRAYLALGGVLALALLMLVVSPARSNWYRWPALVSALAVGAAAIMDAALSRSREQLLRKQEEVEQLATIAERERIARDLHDLLGHTLSLITIKAELAGKLIGRNEAACRREIADIESSARNALAEVRSAVSGYRLSGLAHELANAHASMAAAGVALVTDVAPCAVPAAAENVLTLALREAVTNILRHARASQCVVRLVREGASIRLCISDNGQAKGDIRHGNGLTGMRERVAALGGTLDVRRDNGVTLELIVPAGVS